MRKKWLIGCFLIFTGLCFATPPGISQVDHPVLDSCLYYLKHYRIQELKNQSGKLDLPYLHELFQAEADYLETGLTPDSIWVPEPQDDVKLQAAARFLYARYLSRQADTRDSMVYRLLFESFLSAQENRDTLLINLILPGINHFYFRNGEEMDQFGEYIQTSHQYARDSIDLFWAHYYTIGREMKLLERGEQVDDTIRMKRLITEMDRLAPSIFFKAYGFQQQAIYYDVFRGEKQKALEYYRQAKAFYQQIPYYYSRKGVPSIRFNEAILLFETGQFREALTYFLQHEKEETNAVYQIYGKEWIYKCYEGMGQIDSAYFYFKKMAALKENLDRSGTALQVNKIEFNYSLEQKESELRTVLAEASKQKGRSRTFLIGVVIFAGLNVLAYFLVRKLRRKTGLLEDEKSETIVKLEELKNIVTKDFILLNDKTKVYVSELMYIKSDDHYLNVHLKDGRSQFVRGSLRSMFRELPPNFKRCHRSYIVNENYISKTERSSILMTDGTSIPLSKSYKDDFL